MASYLVTIIWITVGTGLFGGIINFLLLDPSQNSGKLKLWRSLAIGLGAATLVPLFLQTISSDLINQTQQHPENYLVYAGFCIVAAIFSRRFIDTLGERILNEAKGANVQAAAANTTANQALETVKQHAALITPIITRNSEPPAAPPTDQAPVTAAATPTSPAPTVSALGQSILGVMKSSNYTYRNADGISQEVNASSADVTAALNELQSDGFVQSIPMPNNAPPQWALTGDGMNYTPPTTS